MVLVSESREKKSDSVYLKNLKYLTKELVYFYMKKVLIFKCKSRLCVFVILLVVVFLEAEGLIDFDSQYAYGENEIMHLIYSLLHICEVLHYPRWQVDMLWLKEQVYCS